MTIREEIYNAVYNKELQQITDVALANQEMESIDLAEKMTDEIIKIFEKLIDEKITKYENEATDSQTKLDDAIQFNLRHVNAARAIALEELKEELEKKKNE